MRLAEELYIYSIVKAKRAADMLWVYEDGGEIPGLIYHDTSVRAMDRGYDKAAWGDWPSVK